MDPLTAPTLPPAAAALIARAQAAERQGLPEQACELYEQALPALRTAEHVAAACTVLRRVGIGRFEAGDLAAAEDSLHAALAVAETAGDGPGVAHALNVLGTVARTRGDVEAGRALYARARAAAEAAGERRVVAMIDQNIGILANIQGDYRSALRAYRASLAAYGALGEREFAARVLSNLGMLCTDLRRWRAAEQSYRAALELCAALDDPITRLRVESNRVELLVAQERWDEAREAGRAAFTLAGQLENPFVLAEVHKHLGVVARETGDHAAAEGHLRTSAAIAEERGEMLLAAESARELAMLLAHANRPRETLQQLNRAHRVFTQFRARRDLADVDARLASLESAFVRIVTEWGQSIESADRYTQGHCERVAAGADALARAVGFDETALFWFRMGALLHDVGKIVVPGEILNKPGPLTAGEREIMERHPDAGVELLADIEFPWDIRPMVRHHHERWDGTGYPAQLAGEDIPLSARILCVADVYDALASDRPYRRAFTHEQAVAIMAEDAGALLDARLFEAFRELPPPPAHADGAAPHPAAATAP